MQDAGYTRAAARGCEAGITWVWGWGHKCAVLVRRLRDGEEVASISPLAVAEIIWTLKADAGISRFHPNPRRSRLSRWITASICSSSSRGRDVPSSIRLSEKSPAIEASTVVKG